MTAVREDVVSVPVDQTREHASLIALLRTAVVVGVALAVAGTVWLLLQGHADLWWSRFAAHNTMAIVVFAYLLWQMIPKQPRNPVVWSLVSTSFAGVYVMGLAVVAALVDGEVTTILPRDLNPSTLPPAAAWVMVFTFAAGTPAFFPMLTVGLLFFPDGRLPSPRWRPAALTAVVGVAITTIGEAWVHRPGSVFNEGRLDDVGQWLSLAAMIAGLAALVVRFRTSRGVVRQQFKWILWGVSILGPAVVAATLPSDTVSPQFVRGALLAAGVVMLGSFVIAVGRYRLYDIDLVINRTLVFVVLVGFITFVYSVLVVGVGRFVGGREGLLLPILAMGLIATAFEPVRQRTQRWVNRLVYGRRATPYEVLADLMARLSSAEGGEGVLERMARLVHDGTGAQRATVWLGAPGEMERAATWPVRESAPGPVDLERKGVFAVREGGRVVGALEVVTPPGVVLSRVEASLISDLAGSAGLVLGYQRLNASLARRAREVDESRARLVGAQDEERRRLQEGLRTGVEQKIAALERGAVEAASYARAHNVLELAALLVSVADEAGTALDETRALARGMYPTDLVSDGLAAAISRLVERAPVDVAVNEGDVGRYSSELEAAVYFNLSEAVTNAIKHGRPPIRIDLAEHDDMLRFVVSDQGPGLDPKAARNGSGLDNMADRMDAVGGRLTIGPRPGGGTLVQGEIPLHQVPT